MRKKTIIVVALSLTLVSLVSGATLAYYHAQTQLLTNQFKMESIHVKLNEQFSENVKSNVSVTNTSDYVDAKVRVVVNSYYVDNDGNQLLDQAPIPTITSTKWQLVSGTTNTYEYVDALKPGQTSENLIDRYVLTAFVDKQQVVEFAVQAIQATSPALEDAWGTGS